MKMKTIRSLEQISEEHVREFGDRKQIGRLDLVYNVDSDEYTFVPRNIEHKDFMVQIEGNPAALIPVQLRYKLNGKMVLTDLLVGASSFEADCNVRHPPEYIKKAYEQALTQIGQHRYFDIAPSARLRMTKKFAERP
jgi:hypothetical protein